MQATDTNHSKIMAVERLSAPKQIKSARKEVFKLMETDEHEHRQCKAEAGAKNKCLHLKKKPTHFFHSKCVFSNRIKFMLVYVCSIGPIRSLTI